MFIHSTLRASLIAVVGFFVATSHDSSAGKEPVLSVDEMRQILEKAKKLMREASAQGIAASASVSVQIEDQAMILHEQNVRRFLELAEQRRKIAAEERKDLEIEIAELKQSIQAKQWAMARFGGGSESILPSGDSSSFVRQWNQSRTVFGDRFIGFPELSRAEIKSGRALNFFLDVCADVAVEHTLFLSRLEKQRDIDRAGGRNPQGFDQRRLDIIRQLGDGELFTADDFKSVRVMRGLLGPKLPIRMNDEALPLEWPVAIRENPRYDGYTSELEALKKVCLEELRTAKPGARTGTGISISSQVRLMTAMDRLQTLFLRDTERLYETVRNPDDFGPAITPEDRVKRVVALRYLQSIREGVTRFVEARSSKDVDLVQFPARKPNAPPNEIPSTGIRETINFMSRQGLRFAEADANDEPMYERLYLAMRDYYLDCFRLKLTIEADARQLNLSSRQAQEMLNVRLQKIGPDGLGSSGQGHTLFDYVRLTVDALALLKKPK